MHYYNNNHYHPHPHFQTSFPAARPNEHGYGSNWYRRITIEEAMNIALQQVPGEVVKVERETKAGRSIYEVDIVTSQGVKYEVKIDINTGEVIEVEID